MDANLGYVVDLVGFLLTFVYSYLQYLATILGSTVSGLIEKLLKGLKAKGLISGLLSALKGLLDNFATGSIKGIGGIIRNLLT